MIAECTGLRSADLDAWIDIKLFDGGKFVGLKKRGLWYRPNACGYTDRESDAGRYTREEAKKHEYPHDEPVTIHEFSTPNYSSGLAAAMQVLEKCAEVGVLNGEFKLPVSIFRRGDNKWVVSENAEDEEPGSGRRYIVVEAETLPLAICRFARELYQ